MRRLLIPLLALLVALPALAHVGSPDVYFDGNAGPYHLLVTVRPPEVIPGVAQIQIRSLANDVREVKIVPMRIAGPGADLAPVPDVAQRSSDDPQFFSGKLWIMLNGSWKVRVQADGARGKGEMAVPVPAVAKTPLPMQRALSVLLIGLGLFLSLGLVTIVGVAAREGKLDAAHGLTGENWRRGRIAMVVASVIVAGVLYFGNAWWSSEAARNARVVYKLPRLEASAEPGGRLLLQLQNPNGQHWAESLKLDDLVPDHGHLMHLFLIRLPGMDEFLHLHPDQMQTGVFAEDLPSLPAGRYEIFADVVHRTGFPETYVGEIELSEISGKLLVGDDSEASANPVSAGAESTVAQLPDGYRMVWEKDSPRLKAGEPMWLRFYVEDQDGKPAVDLEPYMGMAAHAALVRSDSSVFVHLHPAGSVSMAAVSMAEGKTVEVQPMSGMLGMTSSPEISFPYGFPKPGDYRLFVQVKHAGHVDTGVFDAHVNE